MLAVIGASVAVLETVVVVAATQIVVVVALVVALVVVAWVMDSTNIYTIGMTAAASHHAHST